MLLKFKGYNFTDKDPLEHQYLAGLFKDYGNNIFGNRVFNCVGMSAYGERAYVKRFFSTNEFLYSLQEVGPMAASIKGTVKYEKQENPLVVDSHAVFCRRSALRFGNDRIGYYV
mgnify:CR=1 FL=1